MQQLLSRRKPRGFSFFPPVWEMSDKQLNKSQLVLDALGVHIHVVFPLMRHWEN